jgi:hypothetical protein
MGPPPRHATAPPMRYFWLPIKAFASRGAAKLASACELWIAGVRRRHLRGTHTSLLLDRGVPVHTVAERIGDDPAVLLRNCAKRKRQRGDEPTMDASVSAAIGALAAASWGPWIQMGLRSHCVRPDPTLSD